VAASAQAAAVADGGGVAQSQAAPAPPSPAPQTPQDPKAPEAAVGAESKDGADDVAGSGGAAADADDEIEDPAKGSILLDVVSQQPIAFYDTALKMKVTRSWVRGFLQAGREKGEARRV